MSAVRRPRSMRRGVKRRLSLSIRDCVSPPSAPRPPPPCARRLSLEARAPSPHSRVHLCVVHKVHSVTICVACPSCASRAGVYRSRMTAGRGNYTGYWAARAVRRTRTQPPMAMRRRRPWQLARGLRAARTRHATPDLDPDTTSAVPKACSYPFRANLTTVPSCSSSTIPPVAFLSFLRKRRLTAAPPSAQASPS